MTDHQATTDARAEGRTEGAREALRAAAAVIDPLAESLRAGVVIDELADLLAIGPKDRAGGATEPESRPHDTGTAAAWARALTWASCAELLRKMAAIYDPPTLGALEHSTAPGGRGVSAHARVDRTRRAGR
jgi:hypothetical protein